MLKGNYEDRNFIPTQQGCAVADDKVLDLTEATEQLELNSPAFNLRKRKSLSDSVNSQSSTSTNSGGRKAKRLSTSYSRPGPPTPGRKSVGRGSDKENHNRSILSVASTSSRESKVRISMRNSIAFLRASSKFGFFVANWPDIFCF